MGGDAIFYEKVKLSTGKMSAPLGPTRGDKAKQQSIGADREVGTPRSLLMGAGGEGAQTPCPAS